jgi:hypothetical protein
MPFRSWLVRIAAVGLIIAGAAIAAWAQDAAAVPPPPAALRPLPNPVAQPSMRFGPSDVTDPRPIDPSLLTAQVTGSSGAVPAVPNGSTPPALPGAAVAVPAVTPAVAAVGPAATTPVMTMTVPHDQNRHATMLLHLHRPARAAWSWPTRTPKAAPTPAPVVTPLPSPQAPAKFFRFFHD